MIATAPISFSWGSKTYTGTFGSREDSADLEEGGFVSNRNMNLLVPISEFGDDTRPEVNDKLTLSVDTDLMPCGLDEQVSTVVFRITTIGRSGSALNYTLRTDAR